MSELPIPNFDHSFFQALSSVAESAEAQLRALEECLEVIDAHLPPHDATWVPKSQEDWEWTLRRLDALRLHDRVAAVLKLCQK